MSYVLGDAPKGHSEAFDVLESVFGSEEFTRSDAMTALETALEVDPEEARDEFNRLLRSDAIEET